MGVRVRVPVPAPTPKIESYEEMIWTREHALYLEERIKRVMADERMTEDPVVRDVCCMVRLAMIGLRRPVDDPPPKSQSCRYSHNPSSYDSYWEARWCNGMMFCLGCGEELGHL